MHWRKLISEVNGAGLLIRYTLEATKDSLNNRRRDESVMVPSIWLRTSEKPHTPIAVGERY